jgi:hypothetical protein
MLALGEQAAKSLNMSSSFNMCWKKEDRESHIASPELRPTHSPMYMQSIGVTFRVTSQLTYCKVVDAFRERTYLSYCPF